jgi:XTP/dITP diphosphohydrolase
VRILTLDDAGLPAIPDEDHLERFHTFAGNALAKAEHFSRRSGLPVIADDSGLCVDALAGLPGVRSRRFSGRDDLQGEDLDRANNQTLLDRLHGVPATARTAHYVCVAVLLWPGAPPATALGSVSGFILDAPAGNRGFGYDPLFLLPELGRSFAQVDAATKHRFSHRGRAFRALAPIITLAR